MIKILSQLRFEGFESSIRAQHPLAEIRYADHCEDDFAPDCLVADPFQHSALPSLLERFPSLRWVHLFAGIWGTIAVVLTNPDANLGVQLFSILVVGVFVVVSSAVVWFILKATMGIRVGEEEEINGLDMSELGMEAYPEFSKG